MFTYEYPRPAVTVDAIVVAKETQPKILLIKRGREPFKGKWALPGGFVDMDETLAVACKRELEEETGLVAGQFTQFKVFDAVDRDPRHRTISVAFYCFFDEEPPVKGDDDASDAKWFPVHQLPELGFDHQEIINQFIRTFSL